MRGMFVDRMMEE